MGCHAEFISASPEILNQVQDDTSDGFFDGLEFVSNFDIRISNLRHYTGLTEKS